MTIIKRALPAIAVAGALFGAAGPAQAVNCHNFGCLNRTINSLQAKLNRDEAKLNRDDRVLGSLVRCLHEYPASIYGASDGSFGYTYDPGAGAAAYNTTGLDATQSGETPDAWLLGDSCNTGQATARDVPRSASPFGSVFPHANWAAPSARR